MRSVVNKTIFLGCLVLFSGSLFSMKKQLTEKKPEEKNPFVGEVVDVGVVDEVDVVIHKTLIEEHVKEVKKWKMSDEDKDKVLASLHWSLGSMKAELEISHNPYEERLSNMVQELIERVKASGMKEDEEKAWLLSIYYCVMGMACHVREADQLKCKEAKENVCKFIHDKIADAEEGLEEEKAYRVKRVAGLLLNVLDQGSRECKLDPVVFC